MERRRDLTVRVARTLEEVEELRPAWVAMQWHPNTDIDFYKMIVQIRSNVIRPHVMVVFQEDQPIAILVCRLETIRLDCRFGYKTLYQPEVKSLTILHGGLLGSDTPEIASVLIDGLFRELKKGEIDRVHLALMDRSTHFFKMFRKYPHWWNRHAIVHTAPHYVTELPTSPQELLSRFGRKHRHNIRNEQRRLEKQVGSLVLKLYREVDEVEELCLTVEQVACKTYQRGLGVGFSNDKERRYIINHGAQNGSLRGFVAIANGQPLAFLLATIYNGVAHLNVTGYDPELSRYSPGTILFLDAFGALCWESVKKVDWGLGHADYKKPFSTMHWEESSGYLFSTSLKGLRLNLVRTLINGADLAVKRLFQNLQFLRTIKKRWRQKRLPSVESKRIPIDSEKYEV
ncbi:MAG: GNAT family N-acetyltransferase [Candidatus Omnitrophica bacterium]|nr:GNAT family N-acetyltransferase [bacterium]MBW7937477.1 GNAT family N-acetyltransferase [Candidatus Omnitrophota bacterium]